MEMKEENIEFNPATGKFETFISTIIGDCNPMIVKAQSTLMVDVMNGMIALIEAKRAEYEEVYGKEVMYYAHNESISNNPEDVSPGTPMRKTVHSTEVRKKLLLKAFPLAGKSKGDEE